MRTLMHLKASFSIAVFLLSCAALAYWGASHQDRVLDLRCKGRAPCVYGNVMIEPSFNAMIWMRDDEVYIGEYPVEGPR